MKRAFLISAAMFVAFALAMVAAGSIVTDTAAATSCTCPQIFAPVICSNGQAYDNICYARCDHAKQCVRIGPA
jgi:hypothetical protein